jgi:hypothetical protein
MKVHNVVLSVDLKAAEELVEMLKGDKRYTFVSIQPVEEEEDHEEKVPPATPRPPMISVTKRSR